jgi:SAM-dependent methyltransferase
MLFATPPQDADVLARPTIAWEEVACPLCAGRHGTTLVEAQDADGGPNGLWFPIVQCDSCGTCFTNPRPDPASMGQFYASSYPPHQVHHQQRKSWNPFGFLKKPRVEKRPVPWHGKGRLLDFGCGNGAYLRKMHELGWHVAGIDNSMRMVEHIRDEFGIAAYAGSLPHLELEPESFDVITMWHSLEHVNEPAAVLREARKLLTPGGKIYVATPNIDSLPFQWFGRHWFGLELPRHLTHFTPSSLLLMLQRCGFATEPIQFIRHPDWLRATARRARHGRSKPHLFERLLQYRLPAALFTWYAYLADQTDCILAIGHR